MPRVVFCLLLILFSQASSGQRDADSVEGDFQAVDTIVTPSTDEESFEEIETPAVTPEAPSVYFTDRYYQPSGGGPDSIQGRGLPDSTVQAMQTDPAFWYVNYDFEKKKKAPEKEKTTADNQTPWLEQDGVQAILWILIIAAFLAVLVIFLANGNVRLFRRASGTIQDDAAVQEPVTENIFEKNFQREIDQAIHQGNLRLAVRLLFLRALRKMSERQLIRYQQDKTNFDYLMQLQATRYYPDFFRLTRIYEYSWYGQFEVNQDHFPSIRTDFEKFDQSI